MVSAEDKRIALVDLSRPSDVHPGQLQAAGAQKQRKYSPLVEALAFYVEQGWVVCVFPWVVGIRGMISPSQIGALLEFLDIPTKQWGKAVEQSVLSSVGAMHFMHQVRFGGSRVDVQAGLRQDNSDSDNEAPNPVPSEISRKRQPECADNSEDSALPSDMEIGGAVSQGRLVIPYKAKRQKKQTIPMTHPKRVSRKNRNLAAVSLRADSSAKTRYQVHTGRIRSRSATGHAACAPGAAAGNNKMETEDNGGTQKDVRQRKRKMCNSTHKVYDTDDPEGIQTQLQIPSSGDASADQWHRWRQLADRKRQRQ